MPERIQIDGEIPALIWRGEGEGPRPAIIYLPGGGQTRHDVDPKSRDAAMSRGVTVLSFDMDQHGDRHTPDFVPPERATLEQFLDFVERTVSDLETVVWHLRRDERVDGDRLGIRAISLSASAALAAIGRGLAIKACLSICGSGDFAASASWRMRRDGASADEIAEALRTSAQRLAQLDPLRHVESFPPRSLMMIHGTADRSVPIEGNRALFDALVPFNLDRSQDCVFMTHPGGHGIRRPLHELAWNWLLEHVVA